MYKTLRSSRCGAVRKMEHTAAVIIMSVNGTHRTVLMYHNIHCMVTFTYIHGASFTYRTLRTPIARHYMYLDVDHLYITE